MADKILVRHMRASLEHAVRGSGAYTQDTTGSGFIDLIDGDVDTESMAQDIVQTMRKLGWKFTKGPRP